MNLILRGFHFEVHEIHDDFWPGQMKHPIWLETHNDDCDAKYTSLDMEPRE